jgi:hypothetical protein
MLYEERLPKMDPFSYLSVLISIVLALGIAHLLSALVRVVHNRERSRLYWPSLLFAYVLFVAIVQVWWADYGLSRHEHWTFAAFASTLLIPADLYLLCAILLPAADLPSADDMRAAFESNRIWFFGGIFALPLSSFTQELLVDGHISAPADTAFKLAFAAIALVGMLVKSEGVQKTIALVGAILVTIYVFVLFSSLT